jgi:hypothetical protein
MSQLQAMREELVSYTKTSDKILKTVNSGITYL